MSMNTGRSIGILRRIVKKKMENILRIFRKIGQDGNTHNATTSELAQATHELAQRLKHLRHERGWSQGQVAKKLGVNTQRISKYERGIMAPPLHMLVKLAAVYEVSLDYLLRDQRDPAGSLQNKALLKRLEEMGTLSEKDQRVLTILLDTFIKKRKLEEILQTNDLEEMLLAEEERV